MIPYTFIQNVKIAAGQGSVGMIGEILKENGYTKPFIVYDQGVKMTGAIDRLLGHIRNAGLDYAEYDRVQPDPPSELVDTGYAECIASGCDSVIGIGGGSAIDTGKGINFLRVNGGKILDYADPTKATKRAPGFIGIPTTSGTGAELSSAIMITDVELDAKIAILGENPMSEITIVDPELAVTMPRNLTVLTGLDVFSHVAETYTSVNANIMADFVSEATMQCVAKYLPRAAEDGGDMDARAKMHVAGAIGGWSLKNCGAHVGHSAAHVLGSVYHIQHGACCACSLPAVLEVIAPALPEKVRTIGEILGASFAGKEDTAEIGRKAAEAYRAFAYGRLKVKPIQEYIGDRPVDLDALADCIVAEPLAGLSPVPVTKEVALEILHKIF